MHSSTVQTVKITIVYDLNGLNPARVPF